MPDPSGCGDRFVRPDEPIDDVPMFVGLLGGVRGRPVRITLSDEAAPSPRDKVNREFRAPAPNRLLVSEVYYVATWIGFTCVAFVIDVPSRRVVGWRVSRSAETGSVLDGLDQVLHARRPAESRLIHHSGRGVQAGLDRSSQHLIFGLRGERRPELRPEFSTRGFFAAGC